MSKRIKVLFFYPNEFLGPEMTVYEQIIRYLDRTRFTPYLVLNRHAEGNLRLSEVSKSGGNGNSEGEDIEDVVIQRHVFGNSLRAGTVQALVTGVRLPVSLASVVRLARREGIDVIHCSATPRTAALGRAIARLSGARLLLHYHVIPGRYGGVRGYIESRVAAHADHCVAVSRFLASYVAATGVDARRLDVVVNGVDCERFSPQVDGRSVRREYGIRDDEVLVLQLARIIQQKRQEDVVRAFVLARQHVPTLRCLLVGWEDPRYSGPFNSYREELEHIAREAGLGDSLIIAPPRPDAPELLAASDIVVMPSIEDAWNLVVTEAMACGKPVIGTESGGIPEQVVHGTTGFLVPPRSPEALARYIIWLALDAPLRWRMGRAARLRAEANFDERRLAAGFTPIYEMLATRSASAPLQAPLHTSGTPDTPAI